MRHLDVAVLFSVVTITLAANAPAALAQHVAPRGDSITITELAGGPMRMELIPGIAINERSRLDHRWLVVNSSTCPAEITDAGIATAYDRDLRRYEFYPSGMVVPQLTIQAVEVRFALYDIWGEHLKTLRLTSVGDVAPGVSLDLSPVGAWRGWEDEVRKYFVSVAYIAKVRTAEGEVWISDDDALVDALLSSKMKIKPDELNASEPRE